jgi:hypothetical protein
LSWTASDYAAWYGAFVATCVAGWDVYRYLASGARLKATAQFESCPPDESILLIADIYNRGDSETTLLACVLVQEGLDAIPVFIEEPAPIKPNGHLPVFKPIGGGLASKKPDPGRPAKLVIRHSASDRPFVCRIEPCIKKP